MEPVLADLVERGLASWWAPALAFAAGVVSFASPCVFPLVPGYLSFVAGGAAPREQGRGQLAPILLFIAGFATVFTLLGAFTGAATQVLRSAVGTRVAGLLVAVFGALLLLEALQLGGPALYAERRPLLARVRPGPAWAFPLGVAFGAGWTPCIGPVLAGVLAIAAAQGGSARGALLLLSYSAGLGLPFLLVGVGVRRLLAALGALRRSYRAIAGVSGGVMVAIGLLMLTGAWTRALGPVLRWISRFQPPI